MIKLNLLPSYVGERRKIKVVIIIFVSLLLIEAGVLFKANADLQSQVAWFDGDRPYYESRTALIASAKSAATALQDKAGTYDPYVKFFSGQEVQAYNEGLAKVLIAASSQVGSSKAWFTDMTLSGTTVELQGNIVGLMNFLEFYFKMKDAGYTVTPKAKPTASPANRDVHRAMAQTVALSVKGTLKDAAFPTPPALPGAVSHWGDLFKSVEEEETAAPPTGDAAAGDAAAGGAATTTSAQ